MFPESLVSMKYLPVAKILYDFYKADGYTVLLEHNNTIYMGKDMEESFTNPIQLECNSIKVDLRPKEFYPDKEHAQIIT